MVFDSELGHMLLKVGMFILVQALVYFILASSSNIFSNNINMRSFSFKTARSASMRRILAAVSDFPVSGGEPSSTSRGPRTPRTPVGDTSMENDHRDLKSWN